MPNILLHKWSTSLITCLIIPTPDADSLVRCIPGEDHTNGFFVACFVRAKYGQASNSAGLPEGDKEPLGEKPAHKKKRPADQSEESEEKEGDTRDQPVVGPAAVKRKNKKKCLKR